MEPDLIFKKRSSLANLKPWTNFEFKFLQIKLLGKGIQEKLYFSDIPVSNLRFLQVKWYEKRNQTLKLFMAWKSPRNFRRGFATSTSNQITF